MKAPHEPVQQREHAIDSYKGKRHVQDESDGEKVLRGTFDCRDAPEQRHDGVKPDEHEEEPEMLGTEHGRFEEAHERFGRELPGPVVDQRVEKAPEENEHHDVEDVLTPQLLEGLRTAGVEKERTADHHEHGDAPSRHAVVCVYDVPVEAGNVKLVPIRTGDVEPGQSRISR